MALGELYSELTHSLTSSRPSRAVVERVRERGAPGIPLNTRAVEVRDEIRGVLASWAAVVREGRRVQAPTRNTVALLAFLGHHAGWLAGHEAAEDLVTETDELVKAAWSVLSGRTDRHMVIGPCVRPGCPGTLVAHLGSGTPSGRAAITCSAERGHTWSPDLWHTLHETPSPPRAGRGDAGLTAEDISTGWRIASGTVYWLANTHRWRRRKNGRRVFYDRDDVLATMRARSEAVRGAADEAPGRSA
ncbi:hypothetical protein [Streptomyces sp. TRM49041]|uniref:hypothetical protein n=1 Tax=Streptomyces sp. TRM49041 TaxID=2603216 RepID=UPI001CA3A559|nr:hypothetical protein [Streptomyces sp. TRM49041]